MRIGSINGNTAISAYDTSNEEAAIRKQILSLNKELRSLSSEEEEEQETAVKKKELERQIAELEQKLQQIRRQASQNSRTKSDTDDNEDRIKESGKGEYIDVFV